MAADRIAIIDGVRTPFIKAFTSFNDVPAKELGRIALQELLQRTNFSPDIVDEVVLGTVSTTSDAANLARVVSLLAGVPESKRGVTVSRNCASGMEAITNSCEKIMAGSNEIVLAGGAESMSNVPMIYQKKVQNFFIKIPKLNMVERLRGFWSLKANFFKPVIGLMEALTDPVCGLNMGQTAEVLAKDFGISRNDQDEFALLSHQRAENAKSLLAEEMVPVPISPKYQKVEECDNGVREGQSLQALEKLKPYFERKTGTVTAGNSSQLTDGAAMLLLMKESRAMQLGYEPLGYVKSFAYEGLDPRRMGLGPAFAIPSALSKSGLSFKDIELFEINEAFAAQVIACERALASQDFCRQNLGLDNAVGQIDRSKLNVNGGAIALGHPVGATGARIVLTLLKEMNRRNLKFGVASLCIGGGQGGAIVLER